MTETALDRLSRHAGIAPEYWDIWGGIHRTTDAARVATLRAMRVIAEESGAGPALKEREERPWRRGLPAVAVLREEAVPYRWEICFEERFSDWPHRWMLALETGETRSGEFRPAELARLDRREVDGTHYLKAAFEWRERLPLGYHRFTLEPPQAASPIALTLIIAPGRCYVSPALEGAGRQWGPALPLYAIRSRRNWGMGDFTDLRDVLEAAGRAGAGVVGLNPLHALYPHNPEHCSPYSASSRMFLNALYLDVEAVPEFAECGAARRQVADARFQARLDALRATELVDYRGVAEAKLAVLRALHRHFREHHLAKHTPRGDAFLSFQRAGGEPLQRFALFHALQEHFHSQDASIHGWPAWPHPYRDPAAPQVREYLATNGERVEFHAWLQWLADEQLAACGRRSRELGLGVGLYRDLAVSVDRAGADAWAWRDLLAEPASIGAPPDDFNLHGQDWGLPPFIPERLTECAYAPFVATLRANMKHAGALRIDHVMGLMRLYWVPPGSKPEDGCYVHYPFHDLLGILALESQRNRCLVIGEDLGTVPDAVREALAPLGALSCRLLIFEKERGGFKPPAAYPAQALVAVTTHDLPTLRGYWLGHDLELRARLDLFPSEELRARLTAARAQDRPQLLAALQREALLPQGVTAEPACAPEMTGELALAIHAYLARTPAGLMTMQMEDVLGQLEQMNVPGTTTQYPNWRRKLALELEQWAADPRISAFTGMLRRERGTEPASASPEDARR